MPIEDYRVNFDDQYAAFPQDGYYNAADPCSSMDGSYTNNLPCEYIPYYNNSSEYTYEYQATTAMDTQSSGYYSADNYSGPQSVQTSELLPYNCYQSNQDHLEKYQAAFVNALEGNPADMEASQTVLTDVVNVDSASLNALPVDLQDYILPHDSTASATKLEGNGENYGYEYETNYANNEWTMNYVYPDSYNAPRAAPCQDLANYCLTTCVFTTPPEAKEEDYSVTIPRTFESYDIRIDNYQSVDMCPTTHHSAL